MSKDVRHFPINQLVKRRERSGKIPQKLHTTSTIFLYEISALFYAPVLGSMWALILALMQPQSFGFWTQTWTIKCMLHLVNFLLSWVILGIFFHDKHLECSLNQSTLMQVFHCGCYQVQMTMFTCSKKERKSIPDYDRNNKSDLLYFIYSRIFTRILTLPLKSVHTKCMFQACYV